MAEQIEVGTAMFAAFQVQSSGPGGRKAWCKFTIHSHDAARLMEEGVLGERAFTVQFDKLRIGIGLTVSTISGKRDPDGLPGSGLVFSVPETSVSDVAKAERVVGKIGKLILEPDQMEFDLTAKAE